MKPRGNKPSLLPALAGWIDEWLRIKWKKIIRRKIKNTIKENRGGKDNHGSREKILHRKQGILAGKETDALDKSYFKSQKVNQSVVFPSQLL